MMTTALLLAMACAFGQQDSADPLEKELAPWQRYCRAKVETYRIHPAREPGQPFRRIPEPILIHTQPVRGDQIGEIYIWVAEDQRPAAICSVVVAPEKESPGTYYVVHESHTLYPEPIVGQQGSSRWSPSGPGIAWQRIPNAPPPKGASPRLLDLQARRIAAGFRAHAVERETDQEAAEKVNLRLLPRPLYSYSSPASSGYRSGAVFGFCMVTDLEIILLIESRPTAEGDRWFFACAGFSDLDMYVFRGDTEVWNEAPAFSKGGRVHIGYVTRGVSLPD